jgi:prevent-host-death family protein
LWIPMSLSIDRILVDFLIRRGYSGYMEDKPMRTVGIRELKNKLTYYLRLTHEGDKIIVTDRGSPVAIIQSIDGDKNNVGTEERLASLAKRGMLRLPFKKGRLSPFKSVKATGKLASEIIIEEGR